MTFAATILTLYPEMFLGASLANRYTDGHYSQPGVFDLNVDTRAKDGVNWGG